MRLYVGHGEAQRLRMVSFRVLSYLVLGSEYVDSNESSDK